MLLTPRLLSACVLLVAACGSSPDDPRTVADAPPSTTLDGPGDGNAPADGTGTGAVMIPTWMLEDVQPQSPRAGQTYGLDTFGGQIVVVSLLEGF